MVLSSVAAGGIVFGRRAGAQAAAATGQGNAGISRTAASIHQEVTFKASRKRVYDLLTTAAQFDKVVRASDAMKSGLPPNAKPTEVSRQPGGVLDRPLRAHRRRDGDQARVRPYGLSARRGAAPGRRLAGQLLDADGEGPCMSEPPDTTTADDDDQTIAP
jgi:hypothetical protein